MMAAGKLPGWGLVFGSFVSKAEASARIEANQTALNGMLQQGKAAIVARTSIATHRYSALLVGLGQDDAGSACRHLQALGIDRKSAVSGKSVSVRVALGGRRIITKKQNEHGEMDAIMLVKEH